MNDWSFAKRLSYTREEMEPKVSQEAMAELLVKAAAEHGITDKRGKPWFVTGKAVARWESGLGKPRDVLETVALWSEVTGVSLNWLLTGGAGDVIPRSPHVDADQQIFGFSEGEMAA